MLFTKMEGAGNDYIYFDCMNDTTGEMQEKIIPHIEKLSDRHFGIGGDGVVLICPSKVADARMRMFNADGSEGKMCGNATRCIGKFIYEKGYVKSAICTLETLSGIKIINLKLDGNKVIGATVNMGKQITNPKDIPMNLDLVKKGYENQVVAMPYTINGKEYEITGVSMGNPHCIIFMEENVLDLDLEKMGPHFENDPIFPERVNTEFINVIGPNELRMRVWERGSGETLACGTGSCAVGVAAILNKKVDPSKPILIHLIGGDLTIEVKDEGVFMTGPAAIAFTGDVEID